MRARATAATALLGAAMMLVPLDVRADPPEGATGASPAWGEGRLLERFGPDAARRLLRGGDAAGELGASAEVKSGIDRAISLGTEDGVLLLVQMLQDPHGLARTDASVMLSATRALAPFAGKRAVLRVLVEVVLNAPPAQSRDVAPSRPDTFDWRPPASERSHLSQLEVARETAALALARSGDPQAFTALLAAARKVGGSQVAATRALIAFPPPILLPLPVATPEGILLLATLGDARAEENILAAARAPDRATRLAALRALEAASMDTKEALAPLEAAATDLDPRVREVAAHSLVELGAKDVGHVVRQLVEDEETAAAGVSLAAHVASDEVVGALAARVRVSPDLLLRRGAIVALGRHEEPAALLALVELMADPALEGDAAEAIARSPAAGAWDLILQKLGSPDHRRLAARMAALRGRREGRTPRKVRAALRDLARSSEARDRAVGVGALVLLGEASPAGGLADLDVRVRRAAANSADPTNPEHARLLRDRHRLEKDPETRLLLARGLFGHGEHDWTTTELGEHIRAGMIDAPIAAFELARAADDDGHEQVAKLAAAADSLVRAHAVRGLGESSRPWAIALLAARYGLEANPDVRRAVVEAIARRTGDSSVTGRAHVLESAAFFDPEESIRTLALRARMGLSPPTPGIDADVVWLRARTNDGAPPLPPPSGLIVRPDGLAVPVTFDDDGYCLVPSGRGAARLVLAPRLDSYQAAPHGE